MTNNIENIYLTPKFYTKKSISIYQENKFSILKITIVQWKKKMNYDISWGTIHAMYP